MNKQLRKDFIYEKTRSPEEIRKKLAEQLKYIRKENRRDLLIIGSIAALRWVLRQDEVATNRPNLFYRFKSQHESKTTY